MYSDMDIVAVDQTVTKVDDLSKQRDYLKIRLSNVDSDHVNALQSYFHLLNDPRPKTASELVDRIRSGKYILPSKEDEERNYYRGSLDMITWRDPNLPAERESYELAMKLRAQTYQRYLDIVHINSPAEALKAVQDYEAMKPEDFKKAN